MQKYAIVVAGGLGTRMGGGMPKQFILLNGKPVLYYTLNAFLSAYEDLDVILVLPVDHLAAGQKIIDAFFHQKKIRIVAGGATRFHSVQNGLQWVDRESIVFVHDAVRCLVSTNLIRRCYEASVEYGTAIPVIDSHDSMRMVNSEGNLALERDRVKRVQTPQAFQSSILLPAYKIGYQDKFTDEASVVDASGHKLHLLEGEETNIKITHPIDLVIASHLLVTG
jgi:2-C-methyl-D-erythritol 4-phosphate cytidylyltransferase